VHSQQGADAEITAVVAAFCPDVDRELS